MSKKPNKSQMAARVLCCVLAGLMVLGALATIIAALIV